MKNGRCDHLHSLNPNSPGSYVTATGVSRKWEGAGGSETRCGRNCLIISEDIEPQGVHKLFLWVKQTFCKRIILNAGSKIALYFCHEWLERRRRCWFFCWQSTLDCFLNCERKVPRASPPTHTFLCLAEALLRLLTARSRVNKRIFLSSVCTNPAVPQQSRQYGAHTAEQQQIMKEALRNKRGCLRRFKAPARGCEVCFETPLHPPPPPLIVN